MCMTMHETGRKDGKLTVVSSGGVVEEGRLLLLPLQLQFFMITCYFKNMSKS